MNFMEMHFLSIFSLNGIFILQKLYTFWIFMD